MSCRSKARFEEARIKLKDPARGDNLLFEHVRGRTAKISNPAQVYCIASRKRVVGKMENKVMKRAVIISFALLSGIASAQAGASANVVYRDIARSHGHSRGEATFEAAANNLLCPDRRGRGRARLQAMHARPRLQGAIRALGGDRGHPRRSPGSDGGRSRRTTGE